MESEYLLQRRARVMGLSQPEPEKKKTKIKQASKKKAKLNREYSKVRKEFLSKNIRCQVKGCNKVSEEIHHKKGRIGDLFTNPKFFLAVCRDHHIAIEQDPVWAKEQGYSLSRLKK